jgi:hypothetical protein
VSVDEWDERALCPDGACVGVVGRDGLCKVCGRAVPTDYRSGPVVKLEPEVVAEPAPKPDEEIEDYEWSRRKLCADDTCLGVLGPNGKCKVCGRSAA